MGAKSYFIQPQEVWDFQKCLQASKRRGRDGCGTLHPWPGFIAGHYSPYPTYGLTIRYNGGCVVGDTHYLGITTPLPLVHKDFELFSRLTWGWYIRKKEKVDGSETNVDAADHS